MARTKNILYVKVLIDDREKNNISSGIKIDSECSKDGIFICEIEKRRLITGDLNFQIKFSEEEEWKDMCLVIENKFKGDLLTTLVNNYERFELELQRVKDNSFKMFLIHDYTLDQIKLEIYRLRKLHILSEKIEYFSIFVDKYIEIQDYVSTIQCEPNSYSEIVRRIIKNYVKKFKIKRKKVLTK